MHKKLFLILGLASVIISCQSNPPSNQADNTEVNARDREGNVTSGDQSEKESDRRITQQIRQRVIAENGLSQDAKNIKIITIDAVVTLRGPVNNEKEKSVIVNIAKNTSGVENVVDQVDVIRK